MSVLSIYQKIKMGCNSNSVTHKKHILCATFLFRTTYGCDVTVSFKMMDNSNRPK